MLVIIVGSKHGGYPSFEKSSSFLGVHLAQLVADRSNLPWVEPIALRVLAIANLQFSLEGRYTKNRERILEDLVSVNGGEELELYRGDRDKATVKGQVHRIRIEVMADGTTTQKRIRLPIDKEMLLVSIPALLAGKEPAVVVFVLSNVALPPDEASSFTSPEAASETLPGASGEESPPPAP